MEEKYIIKRGRFFSPVPCKW